MAQSRSVELVGRVLGGRYRLTRPVGTGASAHVYAADDTVLRRRVAVKILHPGLAGDDAFIRRFRAEAQAAAGLRHPNVLQVFDSGDDAGTPYLVMELLGGGSLRSLLDRGQLLTPSQAVQVGVEVARALAYAHRNGVVHRDIKPANLLFDDEGRATVADFGLARALAAATWTEPIGGILGTARYAAPEQVRDEPLDGRADVYALALVLVEAVTGSVPFASDSTVGTVLARLDHPIDPGTDLGPLGAVVAAAGTVGRDARLDAAGLVAALEVVARQLPAPGPIPLVGLMDRPDIERDDAPTEIPGGRPVPFDIEVVDGPAPASAPTGQPPAPPPIAPPPPASPPREQPSATPVLAGGEVAEGPLAAADPVPAAAGEVPVEPADGGRDGGRRRGRRWLLAVLAVLVLGGGGAVAAIVATRPAPSHPVPSLLHLGQAQASAALVPLHLHLAVAARTYSPTVPAGEVLTQVPAGGRLREGSTVEVTVSLGPQPIPVPTDLAGKPQAEAATILTTLGLRVGGIHDAYSLAVPEGEVITAAPSSGTLLPGQAVTLTVSLGKPIVTVPAAPATFATAQASLAALGLGAVETETFDNTVPKGQVIATQPAAGAQVRVGTTVTVVVSKGPDVVTVPSVAGQSVTAAAQALADAGLDVTGVSGNPTATVSGTSPSAGTVVLRGSQVTVLTG